MSSPASKGFMTQVDGTTNLGKKYRENGIGCQWRVNFEKPDFGDDLP